MAVSQEILRKLAVKSLEAEEAAAEIEQFRLTYPDLTEADGYVAEKIRVDVAIERGHQVVGMKLGNTSMAKIAQVRQTMMLGGGLINTEPAYGFLMDYMKIPENRNLSLKGLIHPKIETELAFVTGKDLYGPHIYTPDVIDATAYVCPAFEIIDSRYKDFKVGGAPDALIDNVSSARFKLSEDRVEPQKIDLATMGVRTKINGEYTGFGAGGAVMGHPARAVAKMVRMMYEKMNIGLPAGSVVLSGAIIPSTFIHAGDFVESEFSGLGSISIYID